MSVLKNVDPQNTALVFNCGMGVVRSEYTFEEDLNAQADRTSHFRNGGCNVDEAQAAPHARLRRPICPRRPTFGHCYSEFVHHLLQSLYMPFKRKKWY